MLLLRERCAQLEIENATLKKGSSTATSTHDMEDSAMDPHAQKLLAAMNMHEDGAKAPPHAVEVGVLCGCVFCTLWCCRSCLTARIAGRQVQGLKDKVDDLTFQLSNAKKRLKHASETIKKQAEQLQGLQGMPSSPRAAGSKSPTLSPALK